jgi:EAL domain-containing protein (putative c-di-GMP-specific phosphodiesterase class I)
VDQHETYAARVADALSADVANSNSSNATILLMALAPRGARVKAIDGKEMAQINIADVPEETSKTIIEHNGRSVGSLQLVPLKLYSPPMPYILAIFIIGLVSTIAAAMVYYFARLVRNYVEQVTQLVDEYSFDAKVNLQRQQITFSEFRTLRVATIRSTKRLSREIDKLRTRAEIDDRTGLPNERALNKFLATALDTASYERPVAMILMDATSTTPGYAATSSYAEDFMPIMTSRLSEAVRLAELHRNIPAGSWQLTSLLSGQFALLVNSFGMRDDLAGIVRELQSVMRAPFTFADRNITLSLCGAIVMIPEDADTAMQVRQRAEAALVDLKQGAKAGFTFYSPRLERQRSALVKLETELRAAVEADRFIPLFQPKIDLNTGRICGVEALARWQLESGRLISPLVFIELAEETGLINKIGEQIMRKACIEAAQWNQQGHRINVAVNVSPRQFESQDLGRMILNSIARSGLSPRQLEIEITESLAIQNPERVKAVLKPLRRMGIKLAVDDFGTGHSNLATLTQLDFDVFKIDRQFVSGTPDDKQANAIVDMILSMAHTLEMQIVGEGIETPQQAAFLKARGCHIGQGYLYSPPITSDAFMKMLNEQPFATLRKSA